MDVQDLPEGLLSENNRLLKHNGGLYFVGLKSSVYEFAAKFSFIKKVGNNHFFDSKTEAIRGIYKNLDGSICSKCRALIFKECQEYQ